MAHIGYILYSGASLIDGAPIVLIAPKGKSSNAKTGALLQTYIIRADIDPREAVKSGADSSICGGCPHRGKWDSLTMRMVQRSCYVNIGRGVLGIYRAFQRGRYLDISGNPDAIRELGRGRKIRLGTYGDPAAVPAAVWRDLVAYASGNTGYTHQIANQALSMSQRRAIAELCMVSADTPEDAQRARDSGFRYFRIRLADEPLGEREFACPASEEAGKRLQCADCMACSGSRGSEGRKPPFAKASPVIIAHGSLKKNYRTFRLMAA